MLLELVALTLVHLSALEDFQGFLFDGGLAGAVAHFRELGLVAGEFGVDRGEFDVNRGYSFVDLERLAVGEC